MFAKVWRSIFEEYSAEFRYMAECASLESSIGVSVDKIELGFSGFDDSMPNYIVETFKKMVEMSDADVSA